MEYEQFSDWITLNADIYERIEEFCAFGFVEKWDYFNDLNFNKDAFRILSVQPDYGGADDIWVLCDSGNGIENITFAIPFSVLFGDKYSWESFMSVVSVDKSSLILDGISVIESSPQIEFIEYDSDEPDVYDEKEDCWDTNESRYEWLCEMLGESYREMYYTTFFRSGKNLGWNNSGRCADIVEIPGIKRNPAYWDAKDVPYSYEKIEPYLTRSNLEIGAEILEKAKPMRDCSYTVKVRFFRNGFRFDWAHHDKPCGETMYLVNTAEYDS